MKQWGYIATYVLCSVAPSFASPPDAPLSFAAAREMILAGNGGLKAAATEVEAARSGVRQAGVLPNPSAAIALDRFGTNEIEASVEQTIELGGKRRLRTAAARTVLDGTENSRALALLDLDAEIVRRFIPIAAAEGKLQVLDSIIAIAEAAKEQVRARVDAGAARKTDLIRAELELEQQGLQRDALVRELASARARFAALGGEHDSVLLNVAGELDETADIPSLDALRAALHASPRVAASRGEAAQLSAQQRLLKADAAPDLDVSVGVLRSNADNAYSPLVGVSTTIPLFSRNRAAQDQVALQREAVEQRSRGGLRDSEAEVRDLYSRLQGIDRKLSTLKTSTLPKAAEVYAMLVEYYQAGSVGYLDLTASRTEVLRLRMDLLDIEAERALALAELMQTTSLHIQVVK
jgi:cobalt-zinc-cadmium efflux system outer membrane protein